MLSQRSCQLIEKVVESYKAHRDMVDMTIVTLQKWSVLCSARRTGQIIKLYCPFLSLSIVSVVVFLFSRFCVELVLED